MAANARTLSVAGSRVFTNPASQRSAALDGDARLKQVLGMIGSGFFSPGEPARYQSLVDVLTHGGDQYLLLADYASYIACQESVDAVYRDPREWTRKAILNVANMGKFSSDRTIKEYAEEIWGVKPVAHE